MKLKYEHFFIIVLLLVAASAFVVFSKAKPVRQGLDIKGGVRVVLQADYSKQPKDVTRSQMQQELIKILRARVDSMGVSEPVVQPKGTDQIIVELPDIKNEDAALKMLQSTAQLEFRYFRDVASKERNPMGRYDMEVVDGVYHFYDNQNNKIELTDQEVKDKIINASPLILTGSDLQAKSRASYSSNNNMPTVELEMTSEGSRKFADFTRSHIKEYLAIVLDGKILSAPTINDAITDGKAEISGNMKMDEAVQLAGLLNAGSLPAPLSVIQAQKVDATLGSDAVHAALIAGIVGLGLVLLFMLLYYRLPGFLADIALVFYSLFTFAAFKLIPVTLTLPGIAAFILSIGMAVDANILIFERLKEELRSGKTLKAAVDAGFSRAWPSIRDSNICSLITSFILFQYGTGPIKGFALTLGVGVIISMFTAVTVTRTMLHLLLDFKFAQKPGLYGLGVTWVTREGGKWFDIIGKMYWYFALSALIIIPGLIFMGMGGMKKGIDFTGGSMVQVQFDKTVHTDTASVRAAVAKSGIKSEGIQASDNNTYFVRTVAMQLPEAKNLVSDLSTSIGPAHMLNFDSIGATVSKELTTNALKAVLFAALLIVLYLTYQFRTADFRTGLKYGISAVLATFHDVLVVLGVFAIMGYFRNWEIDSLFVTAILTVIGFSTHDTIVIFDRIRENWKHRERDEEYKHVVNRSILQTLARSINTSFTVILTLTSLMILGGSTIKLLNIALLIGVITGTYSSIFNAPPIMVLWENASQKRKKKGTSLKPGEMKAMVNVETPKSIHETKVKEESKSAETSDAQATAQGQKAKIKPRRKKRY